MDLRSGSLLETENGCWEVSCSGKGQENSGKFSDGSQGRSRFMPHSKALWYSPQLSTRVPFLILSKTLLECHAQARFNAQTTHNAQECSAGGIADHIPTIAPITSPCLTLSKAH